MDSYKMNYADIYDPANESEHMRTRLIPETQYRSTHYAHYEPYGRDSLEKRDFLRSINEDHELWSQQEKKEDKIQKVGIRVRGEFILKDSYKLNGMLWPGQYMSRVFDSVPHTLEMEGIYPDMWEEDIDTEDRENRVSYVFATMLADFVEKSKSEELKKNFFLKGGVGWRWSQNKELMRKIGSLFKRESNNFKVDPNYELCLSDVSVKRYPKHHFMKICDLFLDFMENKEKKPAMNPLAKEFVPGKCYTTPLARTSPKKIVGVYAIEQPKKPEGIPPQRRPTASSKDSTSHLCWAMKGETDTKIEDLEKKLDLLIHLSAGPVITAKKV